MAFHLRGMGFLCFILAFVLVAGYAAINPDALFNFNPKNSIRAPIIVPPKPSNADPNAGTIKEVKSRMNRLDEQDQEAQKQMMTQRPLPLADLPKEAQLTDSDHNSTQDIGKTVGKLVGDIITVVPLVLPFVYYWSTGSLQSTVELYRKATLLSTALSTYGWLLYSVSEVSFNDKKEIVGIDAIVVNSIIWGVISFMALFLVIHGNQLSGKACAVGLCVHTVLTSGLVSLPLFKPFQSTGIPKHVIGVIAGSSQAGAQIIPLYYLYESWKEGPPGPEARIRNLKKLTVLSRSVDAIVTSYWMVYCLLTYNFDAFGIANISCCALSLLSLIAHSAWAISPPPLPAPKDVVPAP